MTWLSLLGHMQQLFEIIEIEIAETTKETRVKQASMSNTNKSLFGLR